MGWSPRGILGVSIERVRLAGGVNRAALWGQVQADVFGVPVEVGASEDASALGAALLAAAGAGQIASLASGAAASTRMATRTYQPNAGASAQYEELHARMTRTIAALR